jgi:sigma-B regulation protein RsbU (phosphoserine phosphatase)
VGLLNFATDEWQLLSAADLQLLSAVGAQASIALERAQLYEAAQTQRLRLEEELAMARAVQASLLPAALPQVPGFTLAAEWRAAREMAGDFYNVIPLPAGCWGLAIADVSDKGAPAALYMAMVHSLIQSAADRAPGPAALLAEVNRTLCQRDFADMFVTVFYAVLEPRSRTLTYALAGHNPPLLRQADGSVQPLPRGGVALGVLAEARFVDRALGLPPGTMLVAYTDGVTEARNAQDEEYGLPRLRAALAAAPADAGPLLDHLREELAAFAGPAMQSDDVTLLVLCSNALLTG